MLRRRGEAHCLQQWRCVADSPANEAAWLMFVDVAHRKDLKAGASLRSHMLGDIVQLLLWSARTQATV